MRRFIAWTRRKGCSESEDLSDTDFRALALKLFDVVIERMGFGGGATLRD